MMAGLPIAIRRRCVFRRLFRLAVEQRIEQTLGALLGHVLVTVVSTALTAVSREDLKQSGPRLGSADLLFDDLLDRTRFIGFQGNCLVDLRRLSGGERCHCKRGGNRDQSCDDEKTSIDAVHAYISRGRRKGVVSSDGIGRSAWEC